MKKHVLLFVLSWVSITLCAQYYKVEISSWGDYNLLGKTFYILPKQTFGNDKDPEFQRYCNLITQSMLCEKAIPTTDRFNADIYIRLDYGVSDESYMSETAYPVYGKTGYTTSKYGTSYHYGITGYRDYTYRQSVYRRYINVCAYDNHTANLLWKTTAASSGESSDMADAVTAMATVMHGYFGENSSGQHTEYVSINEPDFIAFGQNFYLRNNVIVRPISTSDDARNGLMPYVVILDDSSTTILLYARNVKDMLQSYGMDTSSKHHRAHFSDKTYLLYNDVKYPVTTIRIPTLGMENDYINKNIHLSQYYTTVINLTFPIALHRGDIIEMVSYSDTAETKEQYHFYLALY